MVGGMKFFAAWPEPRWTPAMIADLSMAKMQSYHMFSPPFILKDGRTIGSIAEARWLIRSLTERNQHSIHWRYVSGILQKAANSQDMSVTMNARQLMERALKTDGYI